VVQGEVHLEEEYDIDKNFEMFAKHDEGRKYTNKPKKSWIVLEDLCIGATLGMTNAKLYGVSFSRSSIPPSYTQPS
jgi:hypothetical protein